MQEDLEALFFKILTEYQELLRLEDKFEQLLMFCQDEETDERL